MAVKYYEDPIEFELNCTVLTKIQGHPNVVHLIAVNAPDQAIVMDWYACGTVADVIHDGSIGARLDLGKTHILSLTLTSYVIVVTLFPVYTLIHMTRPFVYNILCILI